MEQVSVPPVGLVSGSNRAPSVPRTRDDSMENAIQNHVSFETERLFIRQRTLADTDACLEMDRDPEVTRFISGPWADPTAHRDFVEKRTLGPWPRGMGYWTILLREGPRTFVGWVLLIPADAVGPEIEIGWRLRKRFWGRGFATEAARPILHHALQVLGLPEVVADIDCDNVGSLKVAEKIGMRQRDIIQHSGRTILRYSAKSAEGPGVETCGQPNPQFQK